MEDSTTEERNYEAEREGVERKGKGKRFRKTEAPSRFNCMQLGF